MFKAERKGKRHFVQRLALNLALNRPVCVADMADSRADS